MSLPKPVENRTRHHLPQVIENTEKTAQNLRLLSAPEPPAGLSESYQDMWNTLWTSPIAQLLDPVSDLRSVVRLFELYQTSDDLQELVTAHLAAVKAGAEMDHKLVGLKLRVSTTIQSLETSLGFSPRSRVALGLALLAGRKSGSLDDLADEANEE